MPTFPSIAPNFVKEIGLPDYKTEVFEASDGTRYTMQTQFTQDGTGLTLDYTMIDHIDAAAIALFWRTVGRNEKFTLPAVIIEHPSVIISAIPALSLTTLWRFDAPVKLIPVVATVERGRYDCSIQLVSASY